VAHSGWLFVGQSYVDTCHWQRIEFGHVAQPIMPRVIILLVYGWLYLCKRYLESAGFDPGTSPHL
jgi:hypothetical protein